MHLGVWVHNLGLGCGVQGRNLAKDELCRSLNMCFGVLKVIRGNGWGSFRFCLIARVDTAPAITG